MQAKQRLLAAMRGQETDRMPWSPFLAYYWDFVPPETSRKGQFQFLKDIGADPLLRGMAQLYRLAYNRCEQSEQTNGTTRVVTYSTPVGTLQAQYTYAPAANSWFLTGHPVKTEEDLKTLQFLYEHMEVLPDLQDFEEQTRAYGDEALLLPILGTNLKTAFQSLVEHWMGTEQLVYALMDYPETVEECLAVMRMRDLETVRISAQSQAEGFIFWEDSSTTNISPALFSQYTAPQINEWGRLLHENGKLLVHHACGHLKDLLPLMAQTEIDVIESISPPPTGNITIADAFEKLPAQIGLIGGIEPTVLLGAGLDELEEYVRQLMQTAQGRRYILANSDSCPPHVPLEKFLMISRLVREQSK